MRWMGGLDHAFSVLQKVPLSLDKIDLLGADKDADEVWQHSAIAVSSDAEVAKEGAETSTGSSRALRKVGADEVSTQDCK